MLMLTVEKDCLRITEAVYQNILRDLGSQPPECGGILGAGQGGVVSAWYFDRTGKSTPDSYKPDVTAINRVLQEEWQTRGIYMVGIVHSHGEGKRVPSCGDIRYGIRILRALDTVDAFYLPILELRSSVPKLYFHIVYENTDGNYFCRRIAYRVVGSES